MSFSKKKSLKLNMMLNVIKGLMSIVFPLISFPYISRVLGVENIGKYNFANSIISYFLLIAGLGISTYAIREGARIRDKQGEFKQFADKMFSINLSATIIAYIIFFALLIIVPKFQDYKSLLIILSLQIVFKTIGIEWIYSIYEDFAYITVRSILFQALSLVLMFLLVHNENDVNIYATITVFASVGSNVLNYVHAQKYCKVRWTRKINWHKHLKPIMILFAMSVSITIYVISDITILGYLCGDYTVGLYSVSVKVYGIVKIILSSAIIVSLPRLSALLGNNDIKGFNEVATNIYGTLLTIVIPAIVGIIILRKQIVLFISGSTYLEATSSLMLLSIALFFCLGAWFWGQCILIPLKKEKVVLKATIVSSIINISLNFLLIPLWKENAAAFTTILGEGVAFFWCMYEGKKHTQIEGTRKILLKIVIGCIGIVVCSILLEPLIQNLVLHMIVTVGISVVVYFGIEILLKNETIKSIVMDISRTINRMFRKCFKRWRSANQDELL